MVVKVGRYGKFIACPGYPECKNTVSYTHLEMGHPEIGLETMKRFADACSETAVVEKPAKLDGRNMLMFLAPKTNK